MDLIKLHEKYNNVDTKTSRCLFKYITEVFNDNYIVFHRGHYSDLTTNNVMNQLVNAIFQSEMYNLELYEMKGKNCEELNVAHVEHNEQQYLIYIHTPKELQFILKFCLCSGRSIGAVYIVIAHSDCNIEMVHNILTENAIFHVYVVKLSMENNTIPYYGFVPDSDRITTKTDLVFNCSVSHKQLEPHSDRFYEFWKVRVGFSPVPIYTQMPSDEYTSRYSGIEIEMAKVILNTDELIISNNHVIENYGDNRSTGLLQELVYKKVDVICGGLFFGSNLREIEAGYPLLYYNVIAVTLKSDKIDYFGIFSVFSRDVWLFLLILIIIFVCFLYTTLVYKHELRIGFGVIIFDLIGILFGNNTKFKKTLRLIFLCWIFFTMILRTVFITRLVDLLVDKESLTKQINKLDELCKENYTIVLTPNKIWSDEEEFTFRTSDSCNFSRDMVRFEDNPLNYLYNHRFEKIVVLIDFLNFRLKSIDYIDEEGKNPFHVLDEKFGYMYLSYYFRKGDPLKNVFKSRGLILVENGFVKHYRTLFHNEITSMLEAKLRSVEVETSLSMEHLWVVFNLHFCGMVVSFIVFLAENIKFRFTDIA